MQTFEAHTKTRGWKSQLSSWRAGYPLVSTACVLSLPATRTESLGISVVHFRDKTHFVSLTKCLMVFGFNMDGYDFHYCYTCAWGRMCIHLFRFRFFCLWHSVLYSGKFNFGVWWPHSLYNTSLERINLSNQIKSKHSLWGITVPQQPPLSSAGLLYESKNYQHRLILMGVLVGGPFWKFLPVSFSFLFFQDVWSSRLWQLSEIGKKNQ